MMESKIKSAIEEGIKFLKKEQARDGSFICLTSTALDDYRKAEKVPAIVPSNIVLSSLAHLPETAAIKSIKQKAAQFLLKERGEYWSFNYWFKNSEEFKAIPYPDDLDDTFCALSALYEYDRKLFDGETMGKITTMLTSAEIEEGGPYNMWLVPEGSERWKDIDLVVNSNIGFFLHLNGIELPNLNAFIEKSIDEDDYEFPYNTIYPGIYFISRFYRGSRAEHMIKLLVSKKEPDGKWENPLRTALSVSSLLNFSNGSLYEEVKEGVKYLLQTQRKDGGWEPYSFFFQMRLPEKTLYAGSDATTAALCIEAINKFRSAKDSFQKKKIPEAKKGPLLPEWEKEIHAAICQRARKKFFNLDTELGKETLRTLETIIDKDKENEIVLLPALFEKSLAKDTTLDKETLVALGLGNLYGWMAYDIYDDFLDMEGSTEMLPVANVCLRESFRSFDRAVSRNPHFTEFLINTFDVIDGANSWEAANCRIPDITSFLSSPKRNLPDYGDYSLLAKKSLGHALGPVAVLFALGYEKDSEEIIKTVEFFKHYLIARQLNDDAHDWHQDLKKGQLNGAAVMLLSDITGQSRTIEELEEIFWDKTIVKVSNKILAEVAAAQKILDGLSLVKNKEILLGLLGPIKRSAEKALAEQEETKKFLAAYKK